MKQYLLKGYDKALAVKDIAIINKNKLLSLLVKPPIVHTTDETLDKIVKSNCSVSRFGDGEFALMNGKSLLFQPYSHEINERLRDIAVSSRNDHLVCIPNVFKSTDWCTDKSKDYWNKYLNANLYKIYKTIDLKKEYYDTQVTRLYIDQKDKSRIGLRFEKFKSLWDEKDIVIVEGAQSRLGMGNDLFNNAQSIKRIICPATDAFAKYNEILEETKKQDKSKLVLIALGPTATILAYDLSILGYQAIDIGHIDIEYEWFLEKAQEKKPVQNKYIGEIPGGNVVQEIKDSKYESEVIKRVI